MVAISKTQMMYLIEHKKFEMDKGRYIGLMITSKRGKGSKKTRYIIESLYNSYLKDKVI